MLNFTSIVNSVKLTYINIYLKFIYILSKFYYNLFGKNGFSAFNFHRFGLIFIHVFFYRLVKPVSDESVDDRSVFDIFGDDVEEPESTEAKIGTRPKTTTQTTVSSTRKMSTSSIQEVTSEESNESTNQNPASSEYDDRSSCINLHPPKNGFLQYSAGLSQGSIVTYSCISGFDIRQRGPIRKVILTISPAK